MELIYFFISNLLLMTVLAEPHTLEYHFTTDYYPEVGRISYQAAGHVDDIQIERYDSKTRRVELLLPWMKENINPQHWENHTHIAQYYEHRQQEIIQDIMQYFNHTKGGSKAFVLQVRFWCHLSGNESSGYEEFAANGNNFIVLDAHLSEYIPLVSNAQKIAVVWNSRESSAEKQKWYMEQECMKWFKIYLHHMKESLKPVQPEVKVWGRPQSDDVMRLQCLVYGFYPQDVNVKWVRNGVDRVTEDERSPILHHPDGTYQIRVSVKVPRGERYNYSCHVEHSSLEKILTVNMSAADIEELKCGERPSKHIRIFVLCSIFLSIFVFLFIVKYISGRGHNENTGQEGNGDSYS